MTTDRISLRGLALDTVIGVEAWEQRLQQRVWVDVDLAVDLREAGRTDDLATTIDYATLAAQFAVIAQTPCRLIETLAEALAEVALRDQRVRQVILTVHKPGAVVAAQDVAVTLIRPHRPSGY